MDDRVDVAAGLIIGRDDQRPLRRCDVVGHQGGKPGVSVRDHMHAAATLQGGDRRDGLPGGEARHNLSIARAALADNLREPRRADAVVLQLLVRLAGVDRLMLANVADEQHAVARAEGRQELVHLDRARQAGLVEDEEPFRVLRVNAAADPVGEGEMIARDERRREVPLQRLRRDPGAFQIARCRRGRRQALDPPAGGRRGLVQHPERRTLPLPAIPSSA